MIFHEIQRAIAEFGATSMRVTKSQIAFRRRKGFAYVWWPGQYLRTSVPAVLSIALGRKVASPRFKSVVNPSPGSGCTTSSSMVPKTSTRRSASGCARRSTGQGDCSKPRRPLGLGACTRRLRPTAAKTSS